MTNTTIHTGSNLDILPTLPDNSVDAIVTDPPYELGFMGKGWDKSGIANNVELWRQCLRVLKPGGHLVAFSGSRTYHRMVCAIEDAGFEVRDQMMWVYGSGFPKSHNISKALDKAAGAEREVLGVSDNWRDSKRDREKFGGMEVRGENAGLITAPATDEAKKWDGWGTALKPAHEPIVLARKPLEGTVADNVMKWGTGAINIGKCRVGTEVETWPSSRAKPKGHRDIYTGKMKGKGSETVSTGQSPPGRWPANLMHDGSEEVLASFPGDGSAARFFYCPKASKRDRDEGCEGMDERRESDRVKDDGVGGDNPRNRSNNARRNFHPTVKPTELMAYLCRLVTPPGGIILDPFMGSGSTGRGAIVGGYGFIGIELSPEYVEIAKARIGVLSMS